MALPVIVVLVHVVLLGFCDPPQVHEPASEDYKNQRNRRPMNRDANKKYNVGNHFKFKNQKNS